MKQQQFLWYDAKAVDKKGLQYYHFYKGMMYRYKTYSCDTWVPILDDNKLFLLDALLPFDSKFTEKKAEWTEINECGIFCGINDKLGHFCHGSFGSKGYLEWLLED